MVKLWAMSPGGAGAVQVDQGLKAKILNLEIVNVSNGPASVVYLADGGASTDLWSVPLNI